MTPSRPPTRLEQQQRQKSLALRTIRAGSLVLMLTVALLLILQQPGEANFGQASVGLAINYWVPIIISVVFFLLVLAIDLFTPNKKIGAISGVFLGTLTGILATIALGFIIDLVLQTWITNQQELDALRPIVRTIKVMLGIALCYLCISTVLQTQDQFRLVIPYVEFSKQIRGVRPTILDTSILVDGRIGEIAQTGLLQSPMVIPGFVIEELHALADSGDKLKRTRGRRGLDVLARLQRQTTIDLSIDDSPVTALAVDQAVIELAERLGARVLTGDVGLARVAQIRGVQVLNLHEIAGAFKPALVPGEQLNIKLVKPGEQAGQGVGYLDDGTMVVVDNGKGLIGAGEVAVLVTSTLQTAGGRLVFARPMNPVAQNADATVDHAGSEPAVAEAAPDANTDPAQARASAETEDATPASEVAPFEEPNQDHADGPAANLANAPSLEQPRRPGPFPPKGVRRPPNPARNPRR